MADLFNQDFQDFIKSLNKAAVEYILVGGYAVILHGYIRSTADLDVWVNKTSGNYQRLKKAFNLFGAPIFSEEDFLGNQFDVWGIGMEPNRIEVLNKIKGIEFSEAYPLCKTFIQNNIEVKYIHLNHLIQVKEAAGRFKDKADIEELKKRNKNL
jgi:predicted nucleotidyltransferase